MAQIFGEFSEELPSSHEYLKIVCSPRSVSLKEHWRTNGLSADFMADYFATFFPRSEGATSQINLKAEIKGAVSFIANELLENAMKFNHKASQHPISIQLQMQRGHLVFLATNSVTPKTARKFQAFIETLMTCDPSELYIRQLEKNAEEESNDESGLGFLTMMNDYQARLGWKFEPIQEDSEEIAAITMVQLKV